MTLLHDAADAARWLAARGASRLCSDSRAVQPGDAFVAWPGAARDARAFVDKALQAGAVAALVEADDLGALAFADATRVVALPKLKAQAGIVADAFLEHPSQRLDVLAVTGTNGKTSSAWWIAQALSALQRPCGVIGTLGIGQPPVVHSTGLTTPDPIVLQNAFADFVRRGFAACAIEASSIGIAEERMAGTQVAVALFTNFTRDHLDYHGDMQGYWSAKRRLFDQPGLRAAVLNVDDDRGMALARELAAQRPTLERWTVSAQPDGAARLRALDVRYEDGGLCFDVVEEGTRHVLRSGLIGDYNVLNLLGVLGALRALGLDLAQAVGAVRHLTPVPGRMQRVNVPDAAAVQVVVDYAHTPDALDKALQSLRRLADARQGRLWCVFGCGGDRDASKRPLMGGIAARGADRVVVTSDNPRSELPERIIDQILVGARAAASTPVSAQVDRRAAIRAAVRGAAPADVVLIAGKGHEDYQEITGERLPFSDIAEAQAALRMIRGTA